MKYLSLFFALLLAFPVMAQNNPPQESLSRAPLAALLQSIPETVALAQKEYTSDYSGLNPLQLDLLTEIENRYTEAELSAQSYEALRNAYQALDVPSEEANVGSRLWSSPQRWTQALIAAWLREHPVDLEHTSSIPDLSATVTAHDLNGDGMDEYILFVNADYIGYFVLQHEGSGYRFVDTPLPFGLSGATYWTNEAGSFVDMGFTKNGYDGLPEWHILFGGLSCSNCFLNSGNLYILAWRDDHLVNIVSRGSDNQFPLSYDDLLVFGDDIRPTDVHWDFPSDQIIQTQLLRDSWQCHWHDRTVYQWDKALHLYLYESKTTIYDDSFACAQRVAESAMWHHDYQAAIFIYERALQRDQSAPTVSYDDVFPDVTKEAIQYAQARLALAYSLTGQDTKAEALAAQVRAQTPTSDMMAGVISALSNIPNQYQTCAALYNLFAGYAKSDYSYSVPGKLVVGTVQDNFFPSSMHTDPVSPENAGCDVDALLNVGGRTGLYFPISDDPITHLRDQGIDVASSIHADLDGDGHDDWLIWLTAQVDPIFLKSGTQAYQVSRVHINQPGNPSEIATVHLPNGTSAIVKLYQRSAEPSPSPTDELGTMDTYTCPPLSDQKFHPIQTRLDLWQIVDGALQNTLSVPFCENRSLDQLFPNSRAGSTISAWIPGSQSSIDSYMTQLDQGAYVWNGTTYTIVSAPSSSTRPGSTLPAIVANSHSASALPDDDFNDVFRSLEGEYLNHNYMQVANGGYIALGVAPADADPFILDAIRYYRALSLQFLGQSDDAARELQALALKRGSAWTTLADLHLAPANSR